MQRRTFLASLIATAVLDPEKLLWVPGRKTISIPSTVKPRLPREWVWINLRETRATGLFSNGGRYPGDVVNFLPVEELDNTCSKALQDFKKFCVSTFGAYQQPWIDVEPDSAKLALAKLALATSPTWKIDPEPGSGVWVSAFQKPAW
jgi:hypothetical protein